MVKRDLIDQIKQEDQPKDADETEERKKVIPIKLFDASNKELGDIEIAVKYDEEATMNVDSLKEAIPVDVCNMTEALFFTYAGSGYKLTQEPVYIQHIQAMELTCNVPASTSSPSPTPNPPKSPEEEEDKYAYLKIAWQSLVLKAKVDNRALFRIAEELGRKFVGQKK
jgi:hypothetical protein